jgi:hypothetical protein
VNVCFADLHVHTALSPCADEEMTPPAIVARALETGLAMIAVCDHNTGGNVGAVKRAAGTRLAVIAGVELTSVEECHILGLFPGTAGAERAGAEATALLPGADDAYASLFGEQLLLDAAGARVGVEPAALAAATTLSVERVVDLVHRHDGVAIAAHIDRRSFGVVGQLGLFPRDAGFDGLELSRHVRPDDPELERHAGLGLPMLHSSDSHFLHEIGAARTALRVAAPTFDELLLALRGADGRSLSVA